MKIELCSLFSGAGAFEKGLENTGIDFKIAAYCEIDKYAACAYSAIHGVSEDLNLGDISKVDTKDIPYFNMLTWGFPCQDISTAGKQAGIKVGTRSGLYYEGYRILKDRLPKYSIIENVKNLTSKKHIDKFHMILDDLKELGYKNHWAVLNAKGFGVPQNRERVFIVSILGEGCFEFPKETESGIKLIDILEDEVDEKYFVSDEMANKLVSKISNNQVGFIKKSENGTQHQHNTVYSKNMPTSTLSACDYKDPMKIQSKESQILRPVRTEYGKAIRKQYENGEIQEKRSNMTELQTREDGIANTLTTVQKDNLLFVKEVTKKGYAIATEGDTINIAQPKRLGGLFDKDGKKHQAGAIFDPNFIAPTLDTAKGGWRQPCVPLKATGCAIRGRNPENPTSREVGLPTKQMLEINKNSDISNCLTTVQKDCLVLNNNLRIRRLTPLEYWRLMGFSDEDFYKAQKALCDKFYKGKNRANSQLYKIAGNSIVVNVLMVIFQNLLGEHKQVTTKTQLELF